MRQLSSKTVKQLSSNQLSSKVVKRWQGMLTNKGNMDYRFEDLKVFELAYPASMKIFELSRSFPVEERYSLTDQIRRSSRSVCTNTAEAYRKRAYINHWKLFGYMIVHPEKFGVLLP